MFRGLTGADAALQGETVKEEAVAQGPGGRGAPGGESQPLREEEGELFPSPPPPTSGLPAALLLGWLRRRPQSY